MPDNGNAELEDLWLEFEEICNKNLDLYFSALQLRNEHPDFLSENMRDMLIEYGLIRFFGQWERFIEKCFIDYMLGEKSISGYKPKRYVIPVDAEHAYRIVQNVNPYPDWTDIEKICTNGNNFFENGGSFNVLQTLKTPLNEIKKIRNAIAHTSQKAKNEFENMVRSKIGHSPDGITPAKFLTEYKVGKKRSDPTYYEYYITYIKDSAKILCDFRENESSI